MRRAGRRTACSCCSRTTGGPIDAELCINEGGDGLIKDGKYLLNEIQASEKIYLSFRLEARNPGGHSSLPVRENAIYRLAAGPDDAGRVRVPGGAQRGDARVPDQDGRAGARSNRHRHEGARRGRDLEAATGLAASSTLLNAQSRTTCVATRLEGGHAENALPQMARAVVNCRILPGSDPNTVHDTLRRSSPTTITIYDD